MRRGVIVAALVALPGAAAAQDAALTWQAPAGECPAESEVRAWLAEELAHAPGVASTRVVAAAAHGPEGWSAVIRTRRDGDVRADVVRAPDCAALARLVVQEVVFDLAVLPGEAAPSPPPPVAFVREPPREYAVAEPEEPAAPRVWIEAGLGGGLAPLTGGDVTYAEQNRVGLDATCPESMCPSSPSPGLSATGFAHLAVRVRVSRRVALGVTARVQFGAAPWSVSASGFTPEGNAWSLTKPNDFANLLLGARLYYALSPRGFAARGLTWSAFGGVGLGQIEPTPSRPEGSTGPVGHIVSGYWNLHAGLRAEYGFTGALYVAGELTAHVMFPTTLFDLDATAAAGVHF